jgi:hypothetical protein
MREAAALGDEDENLKFGRQPDLRVAVLCGIDAESSGTIRPISVLLGGECVVYAAPIGRTGEVALTFAEESADG